MTELAALKAIIDGDASGLKAEIASSVGLVDKFTKSASDSAKIFEREFAKSEKAVARLRRSLDPAAAAADRYEKQVEELTSALQRGTVSQAEYSRLLGLAKTRYEQAGAASVAAGRSSRRFGAFAQQAGYQIGDFAVQVQGGTSAATAFAQQGSQLAGALGVYGALAGAAIAIGVPLASTLFNLGDGAADASERTEDLTRASEAYRTIASQSGAAIGSLRAEYGQLASTVRDVLQAQKELAQFDAAQSMKDAVVALTEGFGDLSAVSENAFTSLSDQAQLILDLSEQFRQVQEERARAVAAGDEAAAQAAVENLDALQRQIVALGQIPQMVERVAQAYNITRSEAQQLLLAVQQFQQAATFEEQAAAAANLASQLRDASGTLDEMTPEVRELYDGLLDASAAAATIASTDMASPIGAAASEAATLANNLGIAVSQAIALANITPAMADEDAVMSQPVLQDASGRAGQRSAVANFQRLTAVRGGGGGGGRKKSGGGGGGGTNPLVGQLETLRQSLMTQEETQLASFARQQETLQSALEQQLVTRREYAEMMEDLQRQHSEKMADLSVYKYGDTLQKTGAFFGDLASAFASGNDKMIAMSRKFALAEAAINAARGAAQVLGNPAIPFFAKFAAVAKVMATGAALKQAISSGSSASGAVSAASTSVASVAAPVGPDTVINLRGDTFGRQQVIDLINSINTATENGGQVRLA